MIWQPLTRGRGASALLTGLVVLLAVSAWTTAPAAAQDSASIDALNSRIRSLEQQLLDLRQQVDTLPAPAPAPLPAAAAPVSDEPLPPTLGAQLEVRLSRLENEFRSMNGRVEQVDWQIRQLSTRLDTAISDIQFRLDRMEGGGAAAAPGALPGSTAAPPSAATGQAPPSAPASPSAPAVTGAPAAPSGGVTTASTGSGTVAPGSASLPEGRPEEQYAYAESLLRQADWAEAELAFREFLRLHPDHDLAGNSQYWLGETYYVRENYNEAVVAFAEGFQRYPESPKAPDNLLKMGMSLARLENTEQACATFAELDRRFPDAREIIRHTANMQQQQLGC